MIWCIEDDSSIRDIEIYTLQSVGFDAKGFPDAAAFREELAKDSPRLIILDIMLPGEDGVSILRELKRNPETAEIPVIMATAKGTEYDKIQSLDIGADDYLVKPFGMMEMVSRVKAVLRRCEKSKTDAKVLAVKGLVMNLDEHVLTVDGVRSTLTYKEFEILKLFLSHPGIVYTREQLFENVWGEEYVGETRTVDMHIRTLRQKIGIYSDMIETVRNVGYRMEVSDK